MEKEKAGKWVIRLGKTLGVILASIGLLFLIAKRFPLPKGQGLASVAHPFYALIGAFLAGVIYFILSATGKYRDSWLWGSCILGSGIVSLLIFLLL